MRFMLLQKMTDEMEQGQPPAPEVMAGVQKVIKEACEANIFVTGQGLKPSSQRVHIAYQKGKRTLTDGPFTEAKELVAGFALMRVRSKEEAIAWCDRFAAVIGDVELFMGPVLEPWDFGAPKPADAPLRFLSMHKQDERAENEAPPDPKLMVAMGALIEEMTKAGVMEATGGLGPTKNGSRVHFSGGRHKLTDGPFAESKEMVAGYFILELPSKAAALDWAVRIGEAAKVNEIEVRPLPY